MATTRYGTAVLVSLMVTMLLLFMMQVLIATGKGALVEDRVGRILEFVRVPPVENPPVPNNEFVQPEVVTPPKLPAPEPFEPTTGGGSKFVIPVPNFTVPPIDTGGPGNYGGDYLPIVKVAPVYPSRPLSQGLEGFVELQYTVTRNGSVTDVVVVESSSRLFEKAAIASALKYKYKPRFINGDPVEVRGVGTIIRFALED